jgi:hypothetical protein
MANAKHPNSDAQKLTQFLMIFPMYFKHPVPYTTLLKRSEQ